MSEPAIQEDEHGVAFVAKVVPGSSKTVVAGVMDDMIKVRVAAPPEKGKANQCLIAYLARQLGLKKNAIRIVRGRSSPVKHVQVGGISAGTLREKLGLDKQGS